MTTATLEADSSATDKGWLSSAFSVSAATNVLTAPLYWGYKAGSWLYDKVAGGAEETVLRNSSNPSALVVERLGTTQAFQSPEGQAKLEEIKNDKPFMDALNAAIKNDPSVAPGLLGGETANGGRLDLNQLAESLKDGQSRQTYTSLLNKVAENPNDEFNFTYMTDIATSVSQGDYAQTQALLGRAGITDPRVDMGAQGVMGMISGMINDPDKAISDMVNGPMMQGWPDDSKNMAAGVMKLLANFAQIFMPGAGIIDPYLDLGKRMGGEISALGADARGVANMPEPPAPDGGLTGSAGNPRAASLSGNFNARSSGEPDAAPAAAEPQRYAYNLQAQTAAGMSM